MPIFQSSAVGPPQVGVPSTNKSIMGKDDFLKLLTKQLRYQDPLEPMKGAEFATQLAQFSSVEQLNNISTSLIESINANYMLTQAINNGLSAGFVGKQVRASGDTFRLIGAGDDRQVKLGYELASAATTVKVVIKDDQGRIVRTLQGMGGNKGENTFTWDGKNDNGEDLPDGSYTFSVEAKGANNSSIDASTYFYGKVSGVRFTAEGTKFVINGQEVLLSSILEVLEG
jgi:flagellar basal-body rod modification protein FlgD